MSERWRWFFTILTGFAYIVLINQILRSW